MTHMAANTTAEISNLAKAQMVEAHCIEQLKTVDAEAHPHLVALYSDALAEARRTIDAAHIEAEARIEARLTEEPF